MNERNSLNKVSKDAVNVKKDINGLVEGGVFQLSKMEDNRSQVANKSNEELPTWMEGSASQLSKGLLVI